MPVLVFEKSAKLKMNQTASQNIGSGTGVQNYFHKEDKVQPGKMIFKTVPL